jgi:chemotaxis signal transduction protein
MTFASEAAAGARVDILLFDIGRETFGADASQVTRIGPADGSALSPEELGPPAIGARALVFNAPAGTAGQLRVDSVRGVRSVPIDSLRRMPGPAGAPPYAIGIWLDGENTVLLIDLVELHRVKGS